VPIDVVIPGFSGTSLGIARCLYDTGVEILAIGHFGPSQDIPFYYSNIPQKKITLPENKKMFEALIDIRNDFNEPPILLLSEDRHVLEIAENRVVIDSCYRHSLSNSNLVNKLMDKRVFARIAHDMGLKVPREISISSIEEINNAVYEFSFPFILKPYLRHACKINNQSELESYLGGFSSTNWESVIAQEYIPGNDSSIYFCFVYFDREMEPIAWLTAQKIRQWVPQSGTTSLCRTVENECILEETVRIFRLLGLVGFGSIEYKYHDEKDAYYIMEPTIGRYNKQIALTQAAGVNFPAIAVKYLTEGERVRTSQKNNVWWIHEFTDLRSRWDKRQNVRDGYCRHILKANTRVLFSWNDPFPFFVTFGAVIKETIKCIRNWLMERWNKVRR
jgi:D-aspartate ligase